MNLYFNLKDFDKKFEIVERKGYGHPDTIADHLAEYLSAKYSVYTKQRFGAVLHHNFDKLCLLGGASYVVFGKGHLTRPIRVLLNGRASTKFGDEIIPVNDLLAKWSKEFLFERLENIDIYKDIDFHFNLSNQSSPGKTNEIGPDEGTRKYWFEPRNLGDLSELRKLRSNDTSMGVGYCPLSNLENFVIDIEEALTVGEFKNKNNWIGGDVKLMAMRNNEIHKLTLCIPQISKYVNNINEYKANIESARSYISKFAEKYNIIDLEININTRDDFEKVELYLTATGSSIESGDEGVVGRGNRINKIISPTNPISMEGSAGKNPVYHIGKLYYISSMAISREIYQKFGIKNEVFMVSQSGRDLLDPWVVNINLESNLEDEDEMKNFVQEKILEITQITEDLLNQKITIS